MASQPQSSEPLYAKRQRIFPKAARGTFRNFKWLVMAVTLAIYYITPWLRWDRGPWAPDQAVLVDLAHRRFYFFMIEIWPQEFYYVAGLLIMAGLGLFLVTSSFGRAWCGYSCPQTVWVDLFLIVERFFEGDRNQAMRLDKATWSPMKLLRRFGKHATWILIAISTGGAWVFYFADAPSLARQLFTGTAPFVAYSSIGILTFTTYVFGGWMREQVCIYMCPWPRIQAAMLDEHSLVVTYKAWRGEPRTHGVKKVTDMSAPVGDCVDCMACVQVCPTGIDIRQGPQLACITCALCIDACNDIMAKLGREPDLIGYTTPDRDQREQQKKPLPSMWREVVRGRTIAYFLLWAAIGIAMIYSVTTRGRLDLTVAHDRNPQYVQLSDGGVRNGYTIKILNMQNRPRRFILDVSGLKGAQLWDGLSTDKMAASSLMIAVGPDQLEARRIFVRVGRADVPAQKTALVFRVRDDQGAEQSYETSRFDVPQK